MKDVIKEKEVNLPECVAKECFLFEAVNYMACGCPPTTLMSCSSLEYIEDFRHSESLYYDGIYGRGTDESYNQVLVSELISQQYGIGTDPYHDIKYLSVNHHYSLEKYDELVKDCLKWAKNLPKEDVNKFAKERKLVIQYLTKQIRYDKKLEKILEPVRLQLLAKLSQGEIAATGLLLYKYDNEEANFVEIDDSWREKVFIKRCDGVNDRFYDFARCDPEQAIHRVAIPKEYWLHRNVDWEESELVIEVAKDVYRHCFILINFMDLYSLFPKQIELEAHARLSGNKFLYDGREYIEFDEINKLREKRYIDEKRKGGKNSYQAHKPLKSKVEQLCKEELANKKSYSSANKLCNKVATIIEDKYPELLNSFKPYQSQESEGNDWKRPTFYSWCNDMFKAYKHTKETTPV